MAAWMTKLADRVGWLAPIKGSVEFLGRPARPRRHGARNLGVEQLEARRLLAGTATLSGSVFWDRNVDGTRNDNFGNPGLPGWSVEVLVDRDGNGTAESLLTTVQTDGQGNYSVPVPVPGTYTVRQRPVDVHRLLVSSWDNGSVEMFDPGTGEWLGTLIPPGSGGLTNPADIEIGSDFRLYVADAGQSKILRFDAISGQFLGTFARANGNSLAGVQQLQATANGLLYAAAGNQLFQFSVGDSEAYVPSTSSVPPLQGLYDLALGPDGKLLAVLNPANGPYQIIEFASGAMQPHVVLTSNGLMGGLEVLRDNLLYFTSGSDVVEYHPLHGNRRTFDTAHGGPLIAPIIGTDGNLFVSDLGSDQILEIDTGSFDRALPFAQVDSPSGIKSVDWNWSTSVPSNGSSESSHEYRVAVSKRRPVSNLNFGHFLLSSVQGRVFEDPNAALSIYWNHPHAGIPVELFRDNGDRSFRTDSDRLVGTAITDAEGRYSFQSLAPGKYFVQERPPANLFRILPRPTDPPFHTIELATDSNVTGMDFVNVNLDTFTAPDLEGTVLLDVAGDGATSDDVPSVGTVIQLLRSGDPSTTDLWRYVLESETTTDETGHYQFPDLLPEQHFVRMVPPDDKLQCSPRSISFPTVWSMSDVTIPPINFTICEPASVYGQVFEDMNGNGLRDEGDTGIDGLTIWLTDPAIGTILTQLTQSIDLNGDGVIDPVEERGLYRFDRAGPGEHAVEVAVTPALSEWVGTAPLRQLFNVGPGETSVRDPIGLFKPALLRGTLRLREPEETAPVPGRTGMAVEVFLDDGDGVLDPTTDTRLGESSPLAGEFVWGASSADLHFIRQVERPGIIQESGGNLGRSYYTVRPVSGADIDGLNFQNLVTGALDFGDAAYTNSSSINRYPTARDRDGARHIVVPGIQIGAGVSEEDEPQLFQRSFGDSRDDGLAVSSVGAGESGELLVTVSVPGRLSAWIDFNADGDWDDPGEQIADQRQVGSLEPNHVPFTVPTSAVPGWTVVRARFSTAGVSTPTGLAIDGEVQDESLLILPGNTPNRVTAKRSRGTLIITGDNASNLVGIRAAPDGTGTTLGVVGIRGTLVNKRSSLAVFTGITSISISLGTGNDFLSVGSATTRINLSGGLSLDAGPGDDLILLESLFASGPSVLMTGDADDSVSAENSQFTGGIQTATGAGDDTTFFKTVRFGGLSMIATGAGQDVVGASQAVSQEHVDMLLENDNDRLYLDTSAFGSLAIDAGSGDDALAIGKSDTASAVGVVSALSLQGGLGDDVLDAGLLSDPNRFGNQFPENSQILDFETLLS